MNYYRRYSGDYLRDTARLTLAEHGAYCLMLDYYYSDEQPLPADHAECYILVRAVRSQERRAVDKVLEQYFVLQADGYHHPRVDREIEESRKARARAKENGAKGGRPRKRKTQSETKNETQCETQGNSFGFAKTSVSRTERKTPSNHQPPTSSNSVEDPNGDRKGAELGMAPMRAWGGGTHG